MIHAKECRQCNRNQVAMAARSDEKGLVWFLRCDCGAEGPEAKDDEAAIVFWNMANS